MAGNGIEWMINLDARTQGAVDVIAALDRVEESPSTSASTDRALRRISARKLPTKQHRRSCPCSSNSQSRPGSPNHEAVSAYVSDALSTDSPSVDPSERRAPSGQTEPMTYREPSAGS